MAQYINADSVILNSTNIFRNNINITNVNLYDTPWVNNSMYNAFYNCSNLQEVTGINNSVTDMSHTFQNCTNLVNAPVIPNSVTNMNWIFSNCTNLVNVPTIPNSVTNISYIFDGCTNLSFSNFPAIPNSIKHFDGMFSRMNTTATDVPQICWDIFNNCPESVKTSIGGMFRGWRGLVNAPVIPNSVTDVSYTFNGCDNLINAPTIPNSVTNMSHTFGYCDNLVNAPIIPNSVTNMYATFIGCINLRNIYIYSNQISSAHMCFYDVLTSLTKNVYIPFTYENGVNTQTYNSFIAAGYDTLGTRHGVYLKDLNVINIGINIAGTTNSITIAGNTYTTNGIYSIPKGEQTVVVEPSHSTQYYLSSGNAKQLAGLGVNTCTLNFMSDSQVTTSYSGSPSNVTLPLTIIWWNKDK